MTTADPELDSRPTVGVTGEGLSAARAAVDRFVEELQEGFDRRDADIYNRHFASDVRWGSPFGAMVCGYDDLHAAHRRLLRDDAGGAGSRYRVLDVLAVGEDVAVAQVRREGPVAPRRGEAATPRGGSFSEVALYVLVRRAGQWWLAAGQNTVVRAT
jgi:uncharacterized protein (TIGR02246 family)